MCWQRRSSPPGDAGEVGFPASSEAGAAGSLESAGRAAGVGVACGVAAWFASVVGALGIVPSGFVPSAIMSFRGAPLPHHLQRFDRGLPNSHAAILLAERRDRRLELAVLHGARRRPGSPLSPRSMLNMSLSPGCPALRSTQRISSFFELRLDPHDRSTGSCSSRRRAFNGSLRPACRWSRPADGESGGISSVQPIPQNVAAHRRWR